MAGTATKTKTEATVAEKLDALYQLQKIDSEIDRIRTIRGELPLEVQDLEDELLGLQTRITKIDDEIKDLESEVLDRKNAMKDSDTAIAKYKEQQNNVRNNREFESLAKEIEFQELEIKLHEKKSKEAKIKIDSKKEIVAETQKDEDKLLKSSEDAKKKIDERLLTAYIRLRGNAKNGLSVVPIERDSCGGCFNKIPPQRQLDIQSKKKVLVCEHCGRILVPTEEV